MWKSNFHHLLPGKFHLSVISFASHSCYCLVVPHEQLGIFFQDVVGDLVGHGDDDGVFAFLPGFLESGADSFQAEDLGLFPELLYSSNSLSSALSRNFSKSPALLGSGTYQRSRTLAIRVVLYLAMTDVQPQVSRKFGLLRSVLSTPASVD